MKTVLHWLIATWLLLTVAFVSARTDPRIERFLTMPPDELWVYLESPEIDPIRYELVSAAVESRRMDLINTCFRRPRMAGPISEAVALNEDSNFRGRVVIMLLRTNDCDLVDCFRPDEKPPNSVYETSPNYYRRALFTGVIQENFPNLPKDASPLNALSGRLELATELERILGATVSADRPADLPPPPLDPRAEQFAKMSPVEAGEFLNTAEDEYLRYILAKTAVTSRRLDLVHTCFRKSGSMRLTLDFLATLNDPDFNDKFVIAVLETDESELESGFWPLEPLADGKQNPKYYHSEPFARVLRKYFPDFPKFPENWEPIESRAGRLKLAAELEQRLGISVRQEEWIGSPDDGAGRPDDGQKMAGKVAPPAGRKSERVAGVVPRGWFWLALPIILAAGLAIWWGARRFAKIS